jgi:ammonium transporter Rh
MTLSRRVPIVVLLSCLFLCLFNSITYGQTGGEVDFNSIVDVQKYYRALHIMVMLLAGFGFLMAFLRGYGRSALTATFLLVSTAIPMYIFLKSVGFLGARVVDIDLLIMGEFAAASLLIAVGAVLGRLRMHQYIILGLVFIPFYMFSEWILLEGGLGLIPHGGLIDTGGSIVIHAFGALFGVAVAVSMTNKKEMGIELQADATSDRFSLLGSMLLWIFWPSFCAAIVPVEAIPSTVINVILALAGSTLATYVFSIFLRKKILAADIANAALAGGVAIGSTCDTASPGAAMLIGVIAGAISTFGFAIIQVKLQNKLKLIDTCGVSNLHGIPGILGGLSALVVLGNVDYSSQLLGIAIACVVAIVTGLISGKIILFFGTRFVPYQDSEEFLDTEED